MANIPAAYYDRYTLDTWFERDRANVGLTDSRTGKDVLDLWDDDVRQLVEDGFLDPKDYHGSAIEYAMSLGLIPKPKRKNPGARWHGEKATEAERDRARFERKGSILGSHFFRGKREAHRESQDESRRIGLNPADKQLPSPMKGGVLIAKYDTDEKAYAARDSLSGVGIHTALAVMVGGPWRLYVHRSQARIAKEHLKARASWFRTRKNPGAAWHRDQAKLAEDMEKRETRPRRRTYLKGMADAHALSAHESRKMGLNPADWKEWEEKYRQFVKDHHLALDEKSLRLFGVKSLAHLKQLVEQDTNLNNIPLRHFDALTSSYNVYNPRNRMTLAEGASAYKYLLLKMVGKTKTENPRGARTLVGRVFKAERWAKRWARGRPIRKVKGGWQILAGRKRTNPLTRKELQAVLKAARTSSRLSRKGGRSPRRGTDSARDYFTGRRDAFVEVAHDLGSKQTRYGRRHRFQENPIAVYNPPPGRIIYGRVLAVEAQKTNGSHRGKRFRHSFAGDSRVAAYAMPDGSVLLKSAAGKRLWADR